jgi:hypothetical protein
MSWTWLLLLGGFDRAGVELITEQQKGAPTEAERPFIPLWGMAYIFFAQVFVVASHMPPAFLQWASVFAFVTSSAAKAGAVKASARVTAKIEIKIFMAFTPLRWNYSSPWTHFRETMFREHRPYRGLKQLCSGRTISNSGGNHA